MIMLNVLLIEQVVFRPHQRHELPSEIRENIKGSNVVYYSTLDSDKAEGSNEMKIVYKH